MGGAGNTQEGQKVCIWGAEVTSRGLMVEEVCQIWGLSGEFTRRYKLIRRIRINWYIEKITNSLARAVISQQEGRGFNSWTGLRAFMCLYVLARVCSRYSHSLLHQSKNILGQLEALNCVCENKWCVNRATDWQSVGLRVCLRVCWGCVPCLHPNSAWDQADPMAPEHLRQWMWEQKHTHNKSSSIKLHRPHCPQKCTCTNFH